jgi:hypothetical protein
MTNIKEIPVPDIGDFDEVEVIEILVSAGDSIQAEDSLISLESDKATMEIPSPEAGVVKEIKVSIGDKVSIGLTRSLSAQSSCCWKAAMLLLLLRKKKPMQQMRRLKLTAHQLHPIRLRQ